MSVASNVEAPVYTNLVYTIIMALKNIALSAPEDSIERARLQARQQHTTLNEAFREWLLRFGGKKPTSVDLERFLQKIKHADSGGPFTRDEMNEG